CLRRDPGDLSEVCKPAAVWHHRMATSTAVDHVGAGLAWDYRKAAWAGTTQSCRPDSDLPHPLVISCTRL
ncbi:hypothetical protein, partial [Dactylosporangium siamense]|uniref:hypothetical protein n=1 Tax=Dactylosporangium siamense TaxID=685454 RepID=UPI001943C936